MFSKDDSPVGKSEINSSSISPFFEADLDRAVFLILPRHFVAQQAGFESPSEPLSYRTASVATGSALRRGRIPLSTVSRSPAIKCHPLQNAMRARNTFKKQRSSD
jgi:hypothetical protein